MPNYLPSNFHQLMVITSSTNHSVSNRTPTYSTTSTMLSMQPVLISLSNPSQSMKRSPLWKKKTPVPASIRISHCQFPNHPLAMLWKIRSAVPRRRPKTFQQLQLSQLRSASAKMMLQKVTTSLNRRAKF